MLSIFTKSKHHHFHSKSQVSTTTMSLDHYEKPRNVGSLDKNKKNVGTD